VTKIRVAGSEPGSEELVELKEPAVAAILDWLVPGLGHFYQGRTAKGLLYSISILSTFFFGLAQSHGRAVYASWTDWDRRYPFFCQVGVGLPALPALVQTYRVRSGEPPLAGGIMAPPATPAELNELHRALNRDLELGTVYTMIAGLLNILVIYDAFGGPVQLAPSGDKKKRAEEPVSAAGS
jgi:hypothetical protein